jgi:glutathione S-transferase
MQLISHHLCPFLHRSAILLAKKGLQKDVDYTIQYVPIYDLPKWMFGLSPKGSMPILKMTDGRVLLRSVAINAYFDETIPPSFFPTDAFERAEHRGLILTCGDLLDLMRQVYMAKDHATMDTVLTKLFQALKEVEPDLQPVMKAIGQPKAQMVESSFAALFTLMLHFEKISADQRWNDLPNLRNYANNLLHDPAVSQTKCPDYDLEFQRFFKHFGSIF